MGDRVDFAVDVERRADSIVVRVAGELDMATANSFSDAISPVAASTPHVVVDLRACTFIDSAGMRVITATMNQTERVSIVAFDPAVLRVLEITGVDTVASVHSSLDAAL